jgi:ankyrin repeat protein
MKAATSEIEGGGRELRRTMDDTPLHKARTPEEIERLLDGGWKTDTPGWMGATPLHAAAQRGLPEVVRVLIRRGATVNARRPDRRDTPLHFAASAAVAGLLIEGGAEVEALDWSSRSPLHWAAQFGRADVAEVLIRSGAQVDRPEADGATPLHWAAQEGHPEVIQLLLGQGARPDVPDGHGRTPLHRAAWRGQAAAIEELLRAGADPGIRNRDGQTPLHEAEFNGHQAVASRLRAARGEDAQAEKGVPERPSSQSLALMKVRIHPSRPEALTIAEQAVLTRWSLGETAEVRTSVQAGYPWFADLAVAPEGDLVAVTTTTDRIELRRWDDLGLEGMVACPTEGGHGLGALDISPDGRWIAVADSCEQVHLLDRTTGQVVATLEAGERTYAVRFDPTSRLLATACSFQGGGHVRIDRLGADGRWVPDRELARSDYRTPGKRFVDTLAHVTFSPDGGSLALFETSAIYHDTRPKGWRGDVVLYEVESGRLRWAVSIDAKATGDRRSLVQAGHEMGFLAEVQFLDDETVACGATRGTVLFYRVTDGKLVGKVCVHPEAPVVSLALDRQGSALWAALGQGGGELVRVPLAPGGTSPRG